MSRTTEGVPLHGEGRAHGPRDGRGGALLSAVPGRGNPDPRSGVLPVTVAGADRLQLRRLVRLLSATPGIEVVGWSTSPAGGTAVVAVHDPARDPAPRPVEDVVRPSLSPRQVEVLTAYGAGNDLLEVVARRLGMYPETLKTHLRRVRAKYRDAGRPAPTRRDLYVRAVEDGLLPPPG